MTHLTSITSTQFSKFAVANVPVADGFCDSEKEYFDLFRATELVNTNDHPVVYFGSMRDIPQTGTPANIVKVPVYGEDQSFSIGAQPDSPDLEFTLNLEPEVWAEGVAATNANEFHKSQIKRMTGNGKEYAMAFFYLNSKTENPVTRPGDREASFSLGGAAMQAEVEYNAVGSKANSLMFFRGRVESVLYNPMRDDASTATVTLSITSPDFYGLYTVDNKVKFLDEWPTAVELAAGSLSVDIDPKYFLKYDALTNYQFKATPDSSATGILTVSAQQQAFRTYASGAASRITVVKTGSGTTSITLEVRPVGSTATTNLESITIPITMT